MRVGVLYSGGKDSTLALHEASKNHKIACLITISPKRDDSYMFHYPNVEFVKLQADSMRLPLIFRETTGEKEKELEDLEKAIAEAKNTYEIDGIVSGAVKSSYQATRIRRVCEKLNLQSLNPLWLRDEEKLLKEILRSFDAIITMVAAYPLTRDFLGKNLREVYEDLSSLKRKFGLSLIGEGGEFETFVLDAPLFKKRIKIEDFEIFYKDYRGIFLIKRARLSEKPALL